MHDFDFELPVDGECELNNLEQKLQDKQQLHSLVNVLYLHCKIYKLCFICNVCRLTESTHITYKA